MKTKINKTAGREKSEARIQKRFIIILYSVFCILHSSFSQNIGINVTGSTPNAKALLDIDAATMSPKGGLLIPRMTTAERNAITAPIPESLLIYNTTTQCFEAWNQTTLTWVAFGCIGCIVPTAVTASAAPNPICVGSTLTLTGGATNATTWQWTGPNSYSSTLQSPTIAGITTAGAGVYTLTASNTCASAAPVSTASVSVSAAPTTAAAGTDIAPACGVTTATLAGNTPAVGTGAWSVVSGTATITTPSSPTSGVTGLAVPGTATLRWTISNSPCADSFDDVVITTSACCGSPFTDARDGKSYNTVLIGSQCWMAENLNYSTSGTFVTGVTEQTNNAVIEKYCHNNDAAKCTTYGGLYQWGEIVQYTNGASNTTSPSPPLPANLQGICPSGWHLPTDAEWCTMENTVEAGTDAGCSLTGFRGTNTGNKLKTIGNGAPPLWQTPSAGTNVSGFSALAGGYRWTDGTFGSIGDGGNLWTVTESSTTNVWRRGLTNVEGRVLRDNAVTKTYGISCRCVRD